MTSNRKTILIIRLSALGDVAMTIPAIYSMALRYPDWQVKVLTRPFFAHLFINRPDNISFLLFKDKHKGILGLLHLVREIHREEVCCVADFHNILRSWIIDFSFIIKGRRVAMVHKKRIERLSIKSCKYVCTRPFVLRYADTLERLGFITLPLIGELPQKGSNSMPACPYQKGMEKWIGIAPMARYRNKTYPLDKMRTVVEELSSRNNLRIFVFGGKEDMQQLKQWESGNVVCVAGRMPIEEELSLMSKLDVMVSMDSANMHLASLVSTTVISIWGSTTPSCGFMGWSQSLDNIICAGLECQPCSIAGNDNCRLKNYHCLKAVTPSQIINKVIEVIEKE